MNRFKIILILKDTFAQFWDERQERERQYISVAVCALTALLVYLVGIDPALTGKAELTKSLPALHHQAAEMQRMAQELSTLPRPENLNEVTRDSIEQSLIKSNLKPQSLSVVEGVVRAQISSTSMAALQMWLLEIQKLSGLFVEDIKIAALEEGLVSVSFTLRQSGVGN